jgi:hypothetical protein
MRPHRATSRVEAFEDVQLRPAIVALRFRTAAGLRRSFGAFAEPG